MKKVILMVSSSIFLFTGCATSDISAGDTSKSIYELCKVYSWRTWALEKKFPNIENELIRRKVFTDKEWKLIRAKRIDVGMSEDALICSWGLANRVNRSSYGDAQYVYEGLHTFVYVDESANRITAWNQ